MVVVPPSQVFILSPLSRLVKTLMPYVTLLTLQAFAYVAFTPYLYLEFIVLRA